MRRSIVAFLSLLIAFLSPLTLCASVFEVEGRPSLLISQKAIENGLRNIEKFEWAARNSEGLISFADSYVIPKPRDYTVRRGVMISWKSMGYTPQNAEDIFCVALANTIVEKDEYLDKVKEFVLDVCDAQSGYLAVGAATTGVEVHEGMFFFYLAGMCDILYSYEGLFTPSQKEQIEATMRLYLDKSKDDMSPDGIMNHQASSNAAAVTVSMFLRDEALFDHFVNADGGMIDHIAKGVMPDGWWFEATVNYCYLVTDIYFKMAQIFQNNGLDLYRKRIDSRPMERDFHNAKEDYTGMKFAVWGPEPKPYRTLYDMSMAYIPMMDEDGVVVASNDTGALPPAVFYELAYKEYGDKELAWAISKTERDSWIALFYGKGKLPKVKDPRAESATIANVGLTALRSQGRDRVGSEQLQAYVKYGSHGGWHGHFDRTALLALDRYSHKFFATEMCWFGYISAQYKELVQTSVSHNMVVVDQMQQEAVPSSQPLFFAGELMQLSVTQTNARWRPIPLNNVEKFPPWDDFDYATEPILQRRLSILTDDYLLLVDYLCGEQAHQYDFLVHPIGLESVEGAQRVGELLPAINTDHSSPYKYFTSAQWYRGVDKSVKFQFDDSGVGLDLYVLWPQKGDIVEAVYPVAANVHGFKNKVGRKTIGVREDGREALFINLLEPYMETSAIEGVEALSDNLIEIYLKDGSKHLITISGMRGTAEDITVEIVQQAKNGKIKSERN